MLMLILMFSFFQALSKHRQVLKRLNFYILYFILYILFFYFFIFLFLIDTKLFPLWRNMFLALFNCFFLLFNCSLLFNFLLIFNTFHHSWVWDFIFLGEKNTANSLRVYCPACLEHETLFAIDVPHPLILYTCAI